MQHMLPWVCVCRGDVMQFPRLTNEGSILCNNVKSAHGSYEDQYVVAIQTPCCRAASVIPPGNSRCKIELIFGVMLQFNVVWCIRSRREIVLTIQSDNGKQGYKVGGKKYRRPKVVLPRGPCERYSSDWIRRRDQSWARSVYKPRPLDSLHKGWTRVNGIIFIAGLFTRTSTAGRSISL